MDMIPNKPAFSVKEVQHLIQIARNRVYEEVKTGRIRSIKIGRRIIIPRSEIVRILTVREDG